MLTEIKFTNIPKGTYRRLLAIAKRCCEAQIGIAHNLNLPDLEAKTDGVVMDGEQHQAIVQALEPFSDIRGIQAMMAELDYYKDITPIAAYIV